MGELETVAKAICNVHWEKGSENKIVNGEPIWWKYIQDAKAAIKSQLHVSED